MINWKGAAVLLAIVGVFAAYLYQTRPQSHPAGPSGRAFLGCTAGDSIALEMTGADGKTVDLQRATSLGNWSIKTVPPGPARDSDVDGLITQLHTLTPSDIIPTAAPGVDYGFEHPHLAVACRVGGGVSFNLSVGKQSFDGSSRYARLAGDPKVYVLSGAEVDRLDQFLDQPHDRPSPIPSGSSPSPTT